MNRNKARAKLLSGSKIRHESFLPGEFLYMRNGVIFDDWGRLAAVKWIMSKGREYKTGWRTYKSLVFEKEVQHG